MGIALILGDMVKSSAQPATVQEVQLMVILVVITLFVALIARRLRLPYTLVLVMVGFVIGLTPFIHGPQLNPDVVLFLFLPVLLFEGAWNIEIRHLAANWLPIFLLAVPGLLIALASLTVILHFGIGLSWLLALLVGAIVSPTDPIAALSLLRQLKLSARLRTIVEGESLFNDGIGAAAFTVVLGLLLPSLGLAPVSSAFSGVAFPNLASEIAWLLLGGPLLGVIIGWVMAHFLRFTDDHLFEITITFSTAYGCYLLGSALHTSGLLTVVCAGLVMSNWRDKSMSERTQEAAHDVWEFIGYLANSLLFLLLGIQIGASNFFQALPGILWAFLGVVVGRALLVYILIPLYNLLARYLAGRPHPRRPRVRLAPRPLPRVWRPLLVLTGMRGALSIALVLSLPINFAQRSRLESIVYGVVLITLLGQGLGLRFLLPHWPAGD